MFYPAHVNIQNRKCLVVGAGVVAARKVASLLRSGGDVTLISPEATQTLDDFAQTGLIRWHRRQFQTGDTEGMFLVCAATDHPELNTQVFKEAHEMNGINLVNVVDVIPECTFAAASVVTYGDVMISISTSGKSPAMSRRIREHLETKFGATSLYAESLDMDFIPPPEQGFPYPVYFLLENRRCVVMSRSENMSEALAQRADLLRRCGASVERIAPTDDNHRLSDAFLVCIEDMELEGAPPARGGDKGEGAPNQIQLIECLTHPELGTFTTPLLVMQGPLIISISTNRVYEQSEEEQDNAKRVQVALNPDEIGAELASQFENKGYGEFIDFLGALRPLVMDAIPTQERRQQFFDELIDQIPTNRGQTCCLGFADADCSVECTFNLVRHGQIDRARQYALQRIDELINLGLTRSPKLNLRAKDL
ncbi:bifunctional precorrin-2 dehydrogenase/sirohydrochlorin ferrochelatase [Candidatus Poribacteria bacterium]|nr:bifunctional precorrin-2 dehydrogenase/sirohydrochlorin ferrochelatase [Candidatus Poribacteria bacterium]